MCCSTSKGQHSWCANPCLQILQVMSETFPVKFQKLTEGIIRPKLMEVKSEGFKMKQRSANVSVFCHLLSPLSQAHNFARYLAASIACYIVHCQYGLLQILTIISFRFSSKFWLSYPSDLFSIVILNWFLLLFVIIPSYIIVSGFRLQSQTSSDSRVFIYHL